MADVRLHHGFLRHPKTVLLRRRCGAEGVLSFQALWCFAGETSGREAGDLSGMTDEQIEIAADWQGDPGLLLGALVEVGYIDGEELDRSIHDFAEHQPWVTTKPGRSKSAKTAILTRWHRQGKHAEHTPGCPLCEAAKVAPRAARVRANTTPIRDVIPPSLPFPSLPFLNTCASAPPPPPADANGSPPEQAPEPPSGANEPEPEDTPEPAPQGPLEQAQQGSPPEEPDSTAILAGKWDHLTPTQAKAHGGLAKAYVELHAETWGVSAKTLSPTSKDLRKAMRTVLGDEKRPPSAFARAIVGMGRDPWRKRRDNRGWGYVARHLEKWLELYDERPRATGPPTPFDDDDELPEWVRDEVEKDRAARAAKGET